MKKVMLTVPAIAVFAVSLVVLVGCSSFGVSDNQLKYKYSPLDAEHGMEIVEFTVESNLKDITIETNMSDGGTAFLSFFGDGVSEISSQPLSQGHGNIVFNVPSDGYDSYVISITGQADLVELSLNGNGLRLIRESSEMAVVGETDEVAELEDAPNDAASESEAADKNEATPAEDAEPAEEKDEDGGFHFWPFF